MPWKIEQGDGGYFVVNESTHKRMNHRPLTADEATRYLKALYANTPDVVSKDDHTGMIVCFPIPEPTSSALCGMAEMHLDSGVVPASEMHITLLYLGNMEQHDASYMDEVKTAVGAFAIDWYSRYSAMPLSVEVQGTGRFNQCSEDGLSALYYVVSGPMLNQFQFELTKSLQDSGIYSMSEYGFMPHITYAYIPETDPTPTILFPSLPISFTSVSLWCGPNLYRFVIAESPASETADPPTNYVNMSTESSNDSVVEDEDVGDIFATLTVYKTADGQPRWILYSSNGYEDRERECIETKALEDDCVRADQESQLVGLKAYGPLRWWHHGDVIFERPGDWTSAVAGPGADLGMCDFNVMVDGILVESGTFYDPTYADVLAPISKALRASISFSKPRGTPGPDRVYTKIRRYERSLVPLGYALPSNRFTAFAVRKG